MDSKHTSLLIVIALIMMCESHLLQDTHSDTVPRIAVIGGGIGGTATTYFLHELFEDEVMIDLYESHHVGGRLATLLVADQLYEVGGSFLRSHNQYMKEFATQFGLSQVAKCTDSTGIFNGEDFAYVSSSVAPVDYIKLLFRYGWDIIRVQKVSAAVMQNFKKIYRLQHEGQAFKDVASMLSAISEEILRMTQMSTFDWLREQGIGHLIINELVTAALRSQYGQTTQAHALVGALAVDGLDDRLWSVRGGNRRVAEELLKHSRASVLRRKVTQVTPSSSAQGKFVVRSQETEEESMESLLTEGGMEVERRDDEMHDVKIASREQEYDMVIMATPLTHDKSNILLANFSRQFFFPGYYEAIKTTLVRGVVRPQSFHLSDEMLDNVLAMNHKLIFNSFERQYSVEGENCDKKEIGVWKIFSPYEITESQLDVFFSRRERTHMVPWLACPHYSTNQTLGDFELVPGLYNLNAIEWAASTVEMSVVGAKNVALLAYKHWKNDPGAGRKAPFKEEL